MKLSGSRRCEICGNPIAPSNKFGVCQRTVRCKRTYHRSRKKQVEAADARKREVTLQFQDEYLECIERMQKHCERQGISFVRGMETAIRSYLGGIDDARDSNDDGR